jgi:autoinducer 2 (AI-2) kinase
MSKSGFLAQLFSDVLGVAVEVSQVTECSALGAAICAGVGAGVYKNVDDGARHFATGRRCYKPDPARRLAYQSLYDHWVEMRAARRQADEIAESGALQAIIASAAENGARNRPKTAALRPSILVTAEMDEEGLAALRKLGEVRYESFREKLRLLTDQALVEALAGVQVFITEVDPVDAAVLSKAPDLRVVISCRSNPVNIDIDACTAHSVLVLTTPGRNADSVADLTVSFILMLARKLPQATRFLYQPGDEGDVGRMGRAFEGLKGVELWHKTIGIVGFGAVGQRVARRLKPFGARVVAYDPFLLTEKAVLLDVEPVPLEQLLVESDFVTLHAAVTDESRALLGSEEIAKMKQGAYLINTARAALVDQAALVSALKAEHLAGAAVDVFPIEPPGGDHPLLRLANVIATPHVGGNTFEVSSRQGAIVAADLGQLLRGEWPQNIANRETLQHFSWTEPRPVPSPEILQQLRRNARPSLTDLPIDNGRSAPGRRPSPESVFEQPRCDAVPGPVRHVAMHEGLLSGLKNVILGRRVDNVTTARSEAEARSGDSGRHQNGNNASGVKELRARMEHVLGAFGERVSRDEKILSFAEGRQVTVRYELTDINLPFFTAFDLGAVCCGVGEPPDRPQVTLKMKAEILDKLFTGRENGPKAAMSGKLSFIGDTIKAMSLQRIQHDLNRLYAEARAEVGDLDLVFAQAAQQAPAAAAAGGEGARPVDILSGDLRDEVVRAVEEMYAHGLVTSTGGNVSVRIPGKGEAWITPNASFKGALRPDMLVRIDLEGNPIGDFPYAPSSERLLHCAVYRNNPKVGAVIHSHAPKATTLGLVGLAFLPISTEAAFIGEIPRVPFIMPGTTELADAVGAAVRDAPAVILQNHGLVVGGTTLRHTLDMTFIIEETADKLIVCQTLGKIPPVLPDEIVTAVRNLGQLIA